MHKSLSDWYRVQTDNVPDDATMRQLERYNRYCADERREGREPMDMEDFNVHEQEQGNYGR